MKYTLKHPDTVGAINSSLCVAHCFATPFLFLTQAQTSLVELSSVPLWWQLLNYVFIMVSFFNNEKSGPESIDQKSTEEERPCSGMKKLLGGKSE